jgi:hypothetical protein
LQGWVRGFCGLSEELRVGDEYSMRMDGVVFRKVCLSKVTRRLRGGRREFAFDPGASGVRVRHRVCELVHESTRRYVL